MIRIFLVISFKSTDYAILLSTLVLDEVQSSQSTQTRESCLTKTISIELVQYDLVSTSRKITKNVSKARKRESTGRVSD